ncbi:hypothetical protein Tco_0236798 [Tanacetum coccineum]
MYDYGHLEEIEVRRDDQKLYTFKEGDFKRLCLQDIEDMLLLLVQQKLTNLTIDERYDLNVALRYRQAALSKEVDAESRDVRWWKDIQERYQASGKDNMTSSYYNRSDLPRDIPLDNVVVLRYEKRSKSENKGRVPTKMDLVLEQTQQGTSYEVSVSTEGVEELKRKVKIKGEKKEALLTLRQKPDVLVIRTTSTAANPCQEDSSEFYLITGSIYTDQRGTMVIATIFDEVTKTLLSISIDYH